MQRFAYEKDVDDFDSLSEDKCSYEDADKFLEWLEPIHKLAKVELEDGNVTEDPDIDAEYDDINKNGLVDPDQDQGVENREQLL